MWPFSVGMALTVVVGIALGIIMAQWRTLEYVLDPVHQRALCHSAHRAGAADHPVGGPGIRRQGHHPGLGRDLSHHREYLCRHPRRARLHAGDRRAPMARPNGRFSGRSSCRRLFPSSWREFASRSGLAIIGIIVAEFFTAISGLGGMIVEYANVFATAKLFVPIIVIAIVGVVLTELVMWLERRMSRWRQLERERFWLRSVSPSSPRSTATRNSRAGVTGIFADAHAERRQRILDRRDDRAGRRHAAGFADALDAERIERRGILDQLHLDVAAPRSRPAADSRRSSWSSAAPRRRSPSIRTANCRCACATPPTIWPSTIIGLMTRPLSLTTT